MHNQLRNYLVFEKKNTGKTKHFWRNVYKNFRVYFDVENDFP